jgi:hypothetical protein
MQEIFDVNVDDGFPLLGGAAIANSLQEMFAPGAIR